MLNDSSLSNHARGVTVMIFTPNEAVNLPHCLASLQWCDDVIVIDSFSTDETVPIARAHGARVFQNPFTGFGNQRNWALDNCGPLHEWVLILDADECVPPELARELRELAATADPAVGAYRVRRRFFMWGKWLKHSSLYPTWVVRFVRAGRVRYENRGHAETQAVEGRIQDLKNDLIDENRKSLDDWFERQNRYSTKDAEFESQSRLNGMRLGELWSSNPLLRRAALKRVASVLPARGLLYFLYGYFWRRGFLDGIEGFVFCRMRALYQAQVAIKGYDFQRRQQRRERESRLQP